MMNRTHTKDLSTTTGTYSPATRKEAEVLLQAMREAMQQVPSYVNVQGYRQWLENRLEEK